MLVVRGPSLSATWLPRPMRALLRWPWRALLRARWVLLSLVIRWRGTSYFESMWRRRGVQKVREGFSNLNHPHRAWLLEHVASFWPFESVLEVGCGYGPNLELLARRFPGVQAWGIDINPNSVAEGNRLAAVAGLRGVRLILGKADDLSAFGDRSVDVAFTDAVLYLVGPDKIEKALSEMRRVARRGLLLLELHRKGLRGDVLTPSGWVRDYRRFFSGASVKVVKMPCELRGEPWQSMGYLIIVKWAE